MTRRRVRSSRAGRVYLAHGPRRSSPPVAPGGAPAKDLPAGALHGSAESGAWPRPDRDLGPGHAPPVTAHLAPPASTFSGPVPPALDVAGLLRTAFATVLPCPACGTGACGPQGLCPACASFLLRVVTALPDPTGDIFSIGPHAGICRRLVHALKYRNARTLAGFLARLMHLRLVRWGWRPQVITHLPTSRSRRAVRGYDQAQLLATALASLAGVPHRPLLTRQGSNAKLVGQGRAARAASRAHAFTARGARGQAVLLVDDVTTSGASLAAARAVLLAHGAGEVRAAVVTRTAPPHEDSPELAEALTWLQPNLTSSAAASEGGYQGGRYA